MINRATLAALATRPEELHYRSVLRVLRERVMAAAGIIEDGTAGTDGDLSSRFLDSAVQALGLHTADATWRYLHHWLDDKRRRPGLRIAFQAPPKPAHYRRPMKLSLRVDRGDVWYDLPFDRAGKRVKRPPGKAPSLTLLVQHDGKQVPLIRWPTTIGGWHRVGHRDGKPVYRYKNSAVGSYTLSRIIAAPVWFPPADKVGCRLLVWDKKKKRRLRVVNTRTMGPGPDSAFGLAAGYLLPNRMLRIHGTSAYMSVGVGNSSGCFRLHNNRVIRLYNFLVSNLDHEARGETDRDAKLAIPCSQVRDPHKPVVYAPPSWRGLEFRLSEPIPVEVLPGRIMGKQQRPIQGNQLALGRSGQ